VVCGWEDSPKGLSPRRGSVADLWPDLDEEHQIRLDALLRAATAYDVENRPVGAEAMADALRAWLGQRRAPVTAASPSSTRRPRRQGNALSAALDWWRARVG
jgi:serine/threonine-protein kinase